MDQLYNQTKLIKWRYNFVKRSSPSLSNTLPMIKLLVLGFGPIHQNLYLYQLILLLIIIQNLFIYTI